jgi:hypothetical protein
MVRIASLLAMDGQDRGQRFLPDGWVQEMTRGSRVNAESAMQLARGEVAGEVMLSATDGGDAFWVFPARGLAILNIVNPEGSSDPRLPVRLLGLFGAG